MCNTHVVDQGKLVQKLSKNQPKLYEFIHACSHPFIHALNIVHLPLESGTDSLEQLAAWGSPWQSVFGLNAPYLVSVSWLRCLDAMRETSKLTSCYSIIILEVAVPCKHSVSAFVHTACAQVVCVWVSRQQYTCMGVRPSQENWKLAQLFSLTIHSRIRDNPKKVITVARNLNCSTKTVVAFLFFSVLLF